MKKQPAAPAPRHGRRSLTPHEIDLWISVAKTVARFKHSALPPAPLRPLAAVTAPARQAAMAEAAAPLLPPPATPRLTPLAPLERKIKRRLARGNQPVDGVLDLHGMTQAAAHGALVGFIHRMHADGGQLAIIITGKGRMSPQDGYTQDGGVLRRHTPDWLRAPALRHMVIGFEEAGAPHGGAGALYVRIRRRTVQR